MNNSSSKGSTASVLWLLICAFVFAQFLTPSQDGTCKPLIQKSGVEFLNYVILEFDKNGFGHGLKYSEANRTNATHANRTRVVVNGVEQQIAEQLHFNERIRQSLINKPNQIPHVSSRRHGSRSVYNFSIARGPKLDLLGCDEIDKKFRALNGGQIHIREGVAEIYGLLHHPLIGKTPCVLKKADIHSEAYRRLQNERRKRSLLGTNTRIANRMFGECDRDHELQIVVEDDETSTSLCDDMGEQEAYSYADSKCFNNEKLQNLIEKSSDKTRSAFIFLREMLCLFAEMEDKKFFVTDIHGKHIFITSNFSVKLIHRPTSSRRV